MSTKSPAVVWNYYSKSCPEFAKCNTCAQRIQTKLSNTKGLHTHLKSKHVLLYNELQELSKIEMNKKMLKKEAQIKKEAQPSIISAFDKNVKYPSNHPKQVKFDNAVLDYLTEGHFPSFNSLESEGFKKLIEVADEKLTVKAK